MSAVTLKAGEILDLEQFFADLTGTSLALGGETEGHFTLTCTTAGGVAVEVKCFGSGFVYDANGKLIGGTIDGMTLSTSDGFLANASELSIAGSDWTAALASLNPGHRITALFGSTVMYGTNAANETIYCNAGFDTEAWGRGGRDVMYGAAGGNCTLHGGFGDDVLLGASGNDVLDGGGGGDHMQGGRGDDTYYADSALDSFMEFRNEGNDTLYISGASRALSFANIETVWLSGNGAYTIDLSSQFIVDETVHGGSGNSIVWMASGNDSYIGGAGNETIYGGIGYDHISGGDGNDVLYGGSNSWNDTRYPAIDVLDGGAGNDTLQDVAAGSTLIGGAGNDTFIVNVDVTLVENAGEGYDTVITSKDWVLSANIEKLVLLDGAVSGTGNASDNMLIGNAAANMLQGGDGRDVLKGFAGNDSLDGGAGGDTLQGGLGDDTYYVNQTEDVVSESLNQGIDTVFASASFTLRANVENLTLIGAAIEGTGNGIQNIITGNSLDNILHGAGGDDLLIDGNGKDTFDGGSGQDIASYENADITGLTVGAIVDLQNAAADAGLAAGDTFISIEGLIGTSLDDKFSGNGGVNGLKGGGGNDYLDGRGGDDILLGDAGNDTLIGGDGSDQLTGGRGHDSLKGGSGVDYFMFRSDDVNAGSTDHVVDFAHGTDKIALNFYVGDFKIDSGPNTSAATLIYKTATHTLYFDPDGIGAAIAVALAVFDNGTTLSANDFVVF